nr:hypothetical protein [Paraliobacillus zengyii]
MIFFDIDETLLDHNRAEKLGAIDFYRTYKNQLEYSEIEFLELWYILSKKYFEKLLAKECPFKNKEECGLKICLVTT